MKELLNQEVFSIGAKNYFWSDVVLAAKLWGDWADLERETRKGLACMKLMNVEGDPLAPERVAKLETEFRYAHDLVTAQETESWLKRWGLAVDEWRLYFRRSLLKRHWAERLPEIVAGYPVADDEMEQSIKAEAICSGTLARAAHRLAGRAAAYESLGAKASLPASFSRNDRQAGMPALPGQMEAAFEQFRSAVITPRAVRDRIASHRIDWTRFNCLCVSFPEEQLAREAALCVREDGMELSEVAADAKRPVEQSSFYLDQVEASLKSYLLGASKGELHGPFLGAHLGAQASMPASLGSRPLSFPANDMQARMPALPGALPRQYVLLFVLDKQIPSESDAAIRERAEEALLKSAVDHEINNRVQWLMRL